MHMHICMLSYVLHMVFLYLLSVACSVTGYYEHLHDYSSLLLKDGLIQLEHHNNYICTMGYPLANCTLIDSRDTYCSVKINALHMQVPTITRTQYTSILSSMHCSTTLELVISYVQATTKFN